MFFKFFKKFFLICFVLIGCTEKYTNDACSIEEFVLDSQMIDEGKFAILEMKGSKIEKLNPKLLVETKELIQDDDILNIEIYHPIRDDLVQSIKAIAQTKGFIVSDGKVFIPNLAYVYVKDLNIKDAKTIIQSRFNEEIKDIEVFVSYKSKKRKKVEITGVISSQLSIDSNTRLFDVLSKIHLPSNVNLFKSYILRKETFLAVDFYKLLKKGDMSQNIVMKNNDKIYIAEASSSKIYILGEVQRQRAIEIPDGKISLKDAIAEAGGILYSANRSYIQVFRANVENPKIYVLSWDYITRLPSRSLNLIEGDIVYIATKPLSDWSRFVSQLLPTISVVDSAYRGFKNMGIIIDGN